MTFAVPESKRSIGQNRFHFTLPDGIEYSMPKAKYLAMGQIEKLSSTAEEVQITDLLSLFDDDIAVGVEVRKLDHEQLEALMAAWQADSGLTTGESSASS